MSTTISTQQQTLPAPPPNPPAMRGNVLVQDKIAIPGWVCDLASYRQWAHSDDYPHSGWVSYLNGDIFVDPDREELYTHNQVKGAYAYAIMSVLGPTPNGMYVHDRMLLTNSDANLSTEPDGLFFFWTTAKENRLRIIKGTNGFIELSGTPDMTLEVVSKHSVPKDTVKLRELYWKAGVGEYWLVDARGDEPKFEILRRTEKDYVPVELSEGWLTSSIFQRRFQIVKQSNPLGQPQFLVNVQG